MIRFSFAPTAATVAAALFLPGCESPSDRDPGRFQASAGVEDVPWPELIPLAGFGIADPPDTVALNLSAEDLALRAEALRARALLLSDTVMTPQERAALEAAAASWQGD